VTLVLCPLAVSIFLYDALVLPGAYAQGKTVPEGVDMLLPRGGIPADFDPQFVAANEADIPDEAWVLGVVIDGEAHAYSLNLLNHHEIVNDRFGNLPVAAVW
jgi:hypothetical protein